MYQDKRLEVQAILDKKRINNRMYYLIIWKGLSQEYKCWVPQLFLTIDQIQQFQKNDEVIEVQPFQKIDNKILEQQFEVEDIVKMKINADGKKFYNIKWLGYPTNQNTWEPEEHLSQELKKGYQNWLRNLRRNQTPMQQIKSEQNRKNIIAQAHRKQKNKNRPSKQKKKTQQKPMEIIDQEPYQRPKKVTPVKINNKKNTVVKEKIHTPQKKYIQSALNLMKMPIQEVKGINMFAEEEGNIYLEKKAEQKRETLKNQLMATIFSLKKST